MSVCLTFESWRNYPRTEFRGAVSTLEKNIQICAWVFTFSEKLEKFHVEDLPRTWKKCMELKKAREGRAQLLFLSIKYANFVASLILNSLVGSLSKHDVDDSQKVIWKCNFGFLQSFRNYLSL